MARRARPPNSERDSSFASITDEDGKLTVAKEHAELTGDLEMEIERLSLRGIEGSVEPVCVARKGLLQFLQFGWGHRNGERLWKRRGLTDRA